MYLFYPGGRRGHHWPYQAWPPSADLTVTSHGAREAPSVHVSPRGQTSDIRSQLTVKIERAESERKCDAASCVRISSCVSSSVFRDTRQLSSAQPVAWASPGPSGQRRRETRVQLRQSRDIRVITGAVTSPTLTSGASVTCTSVPVDGQCTLMSNDTSDDQPRDICTGL